MAEQKPKVDKSSDNDIFESEAKSRGPNRPTKELIKQFSSLVKEGSPYDVVCNFLGIPNQTFHIWVRKGRSFNEFPEANPKHEIYGDFVMALQKATAEYHIECTRQLHKSPKGWNKWLAILERRDRKNFSKYDLLNNGGTEESIDPDLRFS